MKYTLIDAYSKLVSIMKYAKKEIIIADGYADITVLDMISKIDVSVILIVKNKGLITPLDIKKYNKQYNNITVIKNDTFHDRYIIIDRNIFYHCGASINYAGSKTFSINLLEDKIVKESLIKYINSILKNNII